MDKRKLILLGIIILIVLIIIIVLIIAFAGGGKGLSAREKTIKVIRLYAEKEEYDRALNLIEKLLLDDPEDNEVQQLQDDILKKKMEKELLTDEEKARLEQEKSNREKEQLDKLIETVEKSGNNPPVVNIKIPEAEKTQPPRIPTDNRGKKIQDGGLLCGHFEIYKIMLPRIPK